MDLKFTIYMCVVVKSYKSEMKEDHAEVTVFCHHRACI